MAHWVDSGNLDGEETGGKPFDPLSYAKRQWNNNKAVLYRIYRTPNDFVVVEAPTASIALHLSQVEKPYKIERFMMESQLIVDDAELTSAVGVYVRPVLDVLEEDSPVISNQILNGLVEASNELYPDAEVPQPAEPIPQTAEVQSVAAPVVEDTMEAIAPPSLKEIMARGGGEDTPVIFEESPTSRS